MKKKSCLWIIACKFCLSLRKFHFVCETVIKTYFVSQLEGTVWICGRLTHNSFCPLFDSVHLFYLQKELNTIMQIKKKKINISYAFYVVLDV